MRLTTDGVHCVVCGLWFGVCSHNFCAECGQLKAVTAPSGRCADCITADIKRTFAIK